MSRKHKHGQHKSQTQRIAEYSARYNRSEVVDWCLSWYEKFLEINWTSEASIAIDWADWCEKAPVHDFDRQCDQWASWEAQRAINASTVQTSMF